MSVVRGSDEPTMALITVINYILDGRWLAIAIITAFDKSGIKIHHDHSVRFTKSLKNIIRLCSGVGLGQIEKSGAMTMVNLPRCEAHCKWQMHSSD
jgi:hypothetical protein